MSDAMPSAWRVVITGIGVVTPLGHDIESVFAALLAGRSGVGPLAAFDASGFRCRVAAEVRDWDPSELLDKRKRKELDRFAEFALVAALRAAGDAGLELTDAERDRAGCYLGVGLGGLGTLERTKALLLERGPSRVSPYTVPAMISNLAAGQVTIALGLRGPSFSVTSACATGVHSIGEAAERIRTGRSDVMIAGGAEACITPVGVAGFEAMLSLSRRNDEPTRASRPFDRGRDGFVMGEGATVLVLEHEERARRRGARIYAEVSGYGSTSDAHHITHPAPAAEGAQRAMRAALAEAGVRATDVGYLNAHATSTAAGDIEEARAIAAVFGAHATAPGGLWVSSTKSMTGHLLGAAGALESAVTALVVATGRVPPTINLDDPDPEIGLDCVPHTARERPTRHALNNAFGFGGTNATLLVSRYSA
jgi:3-oxoacyl-[acyl-carrier-protein] synthase II